uniref:C2H2-type domain-containing protein n=1 Tax=Trichogramma kaykai TaxID=54128 RepID=A0ABD2VUS9_9HYME
MEPGDVFDCAFSVKQEPIDMSLNDNENYQTIDKAPHVQNIELSQFIHGNSIQRLKQEYDETAEPHKDMEIIFECKDIESVHNGVTHACSTCEKKFSDKGNLKKHIDSIHNRVTHACVTPRATLRFDISVLAHTYGS